MDAKTVANSIAYCGLICALCHESDKCAGCKSDHNCCGRHLRGRLLSIQLLRQQGDRWLLGMRGRGPCDRDMFGAEHDVRNRVFVKVAKQEGVEKLAEYVWTNFSSAVSITAGTETTTTWDQKKQ